VNNKDKLFFIKLCNETNSTTFGNHIKNIISTPLDIVSGVANKTVMPILSNALTKGIRATKQKSLNTEAKTVLNRLAKNSPFIHNFNNVQATPSVELKLKKLIPKLNRKISISFDDVINLPGVERDTLLAKSKNL